jgi:hypothetical protein
MSRADLQIILRRAALMLRNVSGVPVEPATEDALNFIAAEMKIGRSDLIQIVLREWLETNAYLPVRTIDEERTATRRLGRDLYVEDPPLHLRSDGPPPHSPILDHAIAVPDVLTHCEAPYGFYTAELPPSRNACLSRGLRCRRCRRGQEAVHRRNIATYL